MFNFVPTLNSLNFPARQIFLIYSILKTEAKTVNRRTKILSQPKTHLINYPFQSLVRKSIAPFRDTEP